MATLAKLKPAKAPTLCVEPQGSPLVLGAGGWNIFHHFGVLDSLARHDIKCGTVVGASAGSTTAAFVTNGYSPDQLVEIFLEMADDRHNFSVLLEAFKPCDPIAFSVGGLLSLEPSFRKMVERYGLKPNNRLKIVACDYFTREPVVFEGEDYDLAKALAASGAVPGVFQPVWDMSHGRPRLLVDGAIYHYNPTEFCDGPAIVSKFRPASDLPREWKTPMDLYFHFRELFFPLAGNNRYVDPVNNLVIETGLPHVAGLNFGLSRETLVSMVENGRKIADEVLDKAIADGRFCTAGA
ncbi:MAG: patatin-like phospholipase family protein [Candidatus Melainabacteria bacterium]|nr:patatin-like phospholipase family protein [Candidatus Melainabacteria bacterium]